MSKICTDIEQSRRLLELGLDPNSSDMYYTPYPNDEYWYDIPNVGMATKEVNQLSAWSLTALLKLTLYGNLAFGDKGFWMVYNGKKRIASQTYDEPIDAAFEMVCWLLENGYIKKV